MKYDYYDLSPTQFENLTIEICFELFGIQTQAFSTGPDGGRDALFHGLANEYPSRARPWDNKTVVQAKHSSAYNSKFNDPDFYSSASKHAVLSKEIERINRLISEGNLDNYILFSNRKLPANASSEIIKFIADSTGLKEANIGLVGLEMLERYMKRYPGIANRVDLNPFDMPLNFEPDELADVIIGIESQLPSITKESIQPTQLQRTGFRDKNKINNLCEGYANAILKKLGRFQQIREFLGAPENMALNQKFDDSAEELNAKILLFKKSHHEFDEVLEKTIQLVLRRDNDCKRNRNLTRTVIYYMYYLCSIGENDDFISD